jgi:outer membrane immunogenic protein
VIISKLVVLTATFGLAAGVATAADRVSGVPESQSAWSGTYIGVFGGYGAFGVDVDEADVTSVLGPFTELERSIPDGFLGGVALGYDMQQGSWVYGIEGDISFSTVSGFQRSDLGGFPVRTDVDLDWLSTVRGRVGHLVNDNLLIYGTAGLAVARVTERADVGTIFVNKNTHFGLAVGGGAERMLANGISLRAEALYVHLGEETYGSLVPADASGHGVVGRLGIGIRF